MRAFASRPALRGRLAAARRGRAASRPARVPFPAESPAFKSAFRTSIGPQSDGANVTFHDLSVTFTLSPITGFTHTCTLHLVTQKHHRTDARIFRRTPVKHDP